MNTMQSNSRRRRWYLLLGGAGVACGALLWQAGIAQEPIGWLYPHPQSEFPADHLGDVPEDEEAIRSLADERVRQFDEFDRPAFDRRETHRGSQVNEERFSVFATTGDEDAELAKETFATAWDEFAKLADNFTDTHRNPDFAIGQLLVIIEDTPLRESDLPLQTLQIQNGQTVVYINVAEGEPTLEEQLPRIREGAVLAMLHLSEIDRKLPSWAQEGLAEYTADKIARRESTAAAVEQAEMPQVEEAPLGGAPEEEEAIGPEDDAPLLRKQAAFGGMNVAGGEYWRLKRVEPDQLEQPDEEEEPDPTSSLEKVRFLLEGNDGKYAPAFLLAIRRISEEDTDHLLASRKYLDATQLLPQPEDTPVDELLAELTEEFSLWQQDPLVGQPLFVPGAEITDPGILAREREMETVLKLVQRVTMPDTSADAISPRITEFGAEGQREVQVAQYARQAMNVRQLYYELMSDNTEPWAILDSNGELLLWTDEERLEEILGLEENRYSSTWRDGHWVLVTDWDQATQLEAWLEPNPANPSRPLVKFAAQPRTWSQPKIGP
ncbi:MAG TPA: hypothetical protein VL096_00875 [Pirellulaceae bacterium]|nr:hypothetical protein [Pirellulaceae bacterium]